jgi:hypothetical protein
MSANKQSKLSRFNCSSMGRYFFLKPEYSKRKSKNNINNFQLLKPSLFSSSGMQKKKPTKKIFNQQSELVFYTFETM